MANKIEIIIPEETSVKDVAYAIAEILKEDYGKHNYKPFIETLATHLGIDIKVGQ